ncbi:MAG: hypothetical protein DRG27_05180 [Deltaproteobacteria bacterium]|nr:MAG: hypothetical protein DRG27_05180 [Deltaproteobacteria bacterium]
MGSKKSTYQGEDMLRVKVNLEKLKEGLQRKSMDILLENKDDVKGALESLAEILNCKLGREIEVSQINNKTAIVNVDSVDAVKFQKMMDYLEKGY